MKFSKKALIALALILSFMLTACAGTSIHTGNSDASGETLPSFEALTDSLFEDAVTGDGISLHYKLKNPEQYGISMDTYTLGRIDLSDFKESVEEEKDTLEKLNAYSDDSLSDAQRITKELLIDHLQLELKTYQSEKDLLLEEPLNSLTGIQSMLPVLMSEYIFYNKEDIEHYIALLEDTDDYFKNILEFEQKKSDAGLFMSDTVLDRVIEQCEEFIKVPDENLLIEIFENKLEEELPSLKNEEKSSYIAKNKKAVEESVVPGYRTLIDGLKALRSTGKNDGGLCHLEGGKAYYTALVRSNTGSDKTPEEMIALLDEKMQEALTTFMQIYSTNPKIIDEMTTSRMITEDTEHALAILQKAIKKDFPDTTADNYTVKYVHPSLQNYVSPAFYLLPPIDEYQTNRIYINQSDQFDLSQIFTTLAHEGYPGHLYQTTYYYAQNPDKIRTVLDYPGYSEGWATYVELMSYDWAYKNPDLSDAFRANLQLSLYLSARADLGIHYEGWSLDDAKNYFAQYGIGDTNVEEIYRIVLETPSNYLSYVIGALEFEQMRTDTEEALGSKFDAKAFHKFILDFGPAPFYIIEKHLSQWTQNYN